MELLTYIYHPAIYNCDSIRFYCTKRCQEQWTPARRISEMIELFVYAIDYPENTAAYCVMDREAKRLYDENRSEYEEKALAMVLKYSCPRPNPSIISLKFAAKRIISKQLYFESEKINQLSLSNSLKQYLKASFHTN
ncbi:unnamed protein product [Rotaria sp. Silwood1]|nr:unnamed protein product [Rotaria sp. Silwood1]